MFVKKATLDDVPAIADIHIKCWKDTYTFIPEEIHKARSIEHRTEQWRKAVLTKTIGERLFVLKTDSGQPVGFTYCRPNPDHEISATTELHATYILKEHRGGISGPILKRTALQYLDKIGRIPVCFWAFDSNKAVIIHRSWGWKGVVKRNRVINGVSIPETGFIHPDYKHLLYRLDNYIDLKLAQMARKKKLHQTLH